MTVLQLGNISVQRIVEHEIPVYRPSDFFDDHYGERRVSIRAPL